MCVLCNGVCILAMGKSLMQAHSVAHFMGACHIGAEAASSRGKDCLQPEHCGMCPLFAFGALTDF